MIVITGANGRLGQTAARALQRILPIGEIRLAARDPQKLSLMKEEGFSVVPGDYDRRAEIDDALQGASAVLLISSNHPETAERVRQHRSVIEAAGLWGSKVVYTSFVNQGRASRFAGVEAHIATEEILRAAALTHTILRNNQYIANIEGLLRQAHKTGTFAIPGAIGRVAYIAHADIAEVAALALTMPAHDNRAYELTGPAALDGTEIAELLSLHHGRQIASVDAPYDDFRSHFYSLGMNEQAVEGLISLYLAAAAGEYSEVTGDVQLILGRPATSLATYLRQ